MSSYNTDHHCHYYLYERYVHYGDSVLVCAIGVHSGPQGNYQVSQGQQAQQVQKNVEQMSLAPIGNPVG